jgi:8-oxo-dGTP diphosphatase
MPSKRSSDDQYRFCPRCSSALEPFQDENQRRLRCPSCGWIRYRNPTAGVAVILLSGGKVLLGLRRDGGWCIPCGHVEWDETVEEAAKREMQEEIGLEVDLARVYAVHSNFHDPESHTVGIWYLGAASLLSAARAGGDLAEIRLFPLDELPALIFPTDRIVAQRLQAEFPSGQSAS